MAKEEIIVGVDVGTSKVCVVIGSFIPQEGINIIGVGTVSSTGLKKGVVVDIESTTKAIQQALDEALLMAGCEVEEIFLNISGESIQGINSSAMIALREHKVQANDIRHVLAGARAISLPSGCEIIYSMPKEFLLDEVEGISKPLGMSGMRLEVKTHIITASMSAVQNLKNCAHNNGLYVSQIIFDGLASAEAVLHQDEKELGSVCVDIGAGTTDIAIYTNGSIVHSAVLPIGGDLVTNDIAIGLRISTSEAEQVKIKYGYVNRPGQPQKHNDILTVPATMGRRPKKFNRQILAEIIEPRMEELFLLIKEECHRAGFEDILNLGLVLTGGTINLDGVCEFAEGVLGVPVRRGVPRHVGGLTNVIKSPIYATGVGLILAGQQIEESSYKSQDTGGLKTYFKKIKQWIGDFF